MRRPASNGAKRTVKPHASTNAKLGGKTAAGKRSKAKKMTAKSSSSRSGAANNAVPVKPKGRHPHPKMQSRRQALGRQYRFDRAIRRALTLRKGKALEAEWIQDILDYFGDNTLAADDAYVTAVLAAAMDAEGPILQCGANALTLLVALVTQQRSDYLWTLEHNPSTASSFRSLLQRYDIRAGQVLDAPAEAFGDHIWYVTDVKQLPKEICLVLCDGSNVLPTGLRGVVRRLEHNLSQRCVLLVRHTKRPKDLDFASKWAKSCNAPFILNDSGEPFVKIALRDQAKEAELAEDRALTIFDGVTEPEPLFAPKRAHSKL